MKVFQMKMANNFNFYLRNGKVTNCTDPRYPIVYSSTFWDGKTKVWTTKKHSDNDPDHVPDKVICPAWRIDKTYFYDCMSERIPALIDASLVRQEDPKITNIIILTRDISKIINQKNIIEIGMCTKQAYTNYQNKKLQKIVDSYFNNRAFW